MTVLETTSTAPTTVPTTDSEGIIRARAAFLREVAAGVDPLLARSFRRRAAELELTAWVLAVRDEGPTPVS
ncbi:MAG: hypothetical protein FGM58_06885 [Acidimicrobiia bacterium]|nr:hypothetical protein [Acidimicrobiia bacterium]